MYSEACAFLVQAAGCAGAHVLQNEQVEKRDYRADRHAVPRLWRTVQEARGMLGGRRWTRRKPRKCPRIQEKKKVTTFFVKTK